MVAAAEDRELPGLDGPALAADRAAPGEHVGQRVEVLRPGQRELRARGDGGVDHRDRGVGLARAPEAADLAGDHPHERAAVGRRGERDVARLEALVAGLDHLVLGREVDPQLDAVEQPARLDQPGRRRLDVEDAPTGGHPLGGAVADEAPAAVRVLVLHGAVDHVGDGLEAPVRVPARAPRLTGGVVDLAHLVHVDEGVEVGEVDAGEGPADREALALEAGGGGRHGADRPLAGVDREPGRGWGRWWCLRSRRASDPPDRCACNHFNGGEALSIPDHRALRTRSGPPPEGRAATGLLVLRSAGELEQATGVRAEDVVGHVQRAAVERQRAGLGQLATGQLGHLTALELEQHGGRAAGRAEAARLERPDAVLGVLEGVDGRAVRATPRAPRSRSARPCTSVQLGVRDRRVGRADGVGDASGDLPDARGAGTEREALQLTDVDRSRSADTATDVATASAGIAAAGRDARPAGGDRSSRARAPAERPATPDPTS